MPLLNISLPFLIILIVAALYSPGISGPFLFDDQSSITSNPAIAIKEVSSESLYNAAESGIAGPLKRPIAMISFALNYYYAGGYIAKPFKITNIIIHCINVLLVYLLALQVLKLSYPNKKSLFWFAAAISLFWGAHPINLTSVLYLVQRMTSLSTLFSLSCIILYLSARQKIIHKGLNWQSIAFFFFSALSLILALYSKENAVVVPLIIIAAELILFAKHSPWKHYEQLTKANKTILWLVTLGILAYCLNYAIGYASSGFSTRPFTMLERVMTETRVVSNYISLIFIPQINGFGLFHDDIALSTSLFAPWTTVSSIFFLTALISCAYFYRRKYPLFAFGIAWFFIGHLLESTFFPLEIAHEHRNNLPSVGIIIAVASLFISNNINTKKTILSLLIPCLIVGSITLLRAKQWSNAYDQAYYETVHHPGSAAAHSIFSYAAFQQKRVNEALTALKRAMELSPDEAAFAIFYQHALTVTEQKVPLTLQRETLRRLRDGITSPTTINSLDQMVNCLKTKEPCKRLIKNALAWADTMIEKHPNDYIYYYFKGMNLQANQQDRLALQAYQKGFELNKGKLHLLLEISNLYIRHHDIDNLAKTIEVFREVNLSTSQPQDEVLKQLEDSLRKIERIYSNEQAKSSLNAQKRPYQP